MEFATNRRVLAYVAVVAAGVAVIATAFRMSLRGDPAAEWLPWLAFWVLVLTPPLVPVSIHTLRPEASSTTVQVALGAMFGVWIVVGGVLFVVGIRDFLVYLVVAGGVVGVLATVRNLATSKTTV